MDIPYDQDRAHRDIRVLINLKAAEGIMGWQSHENLTWLAKQAKKHLRIVEVGTFAGRSARALGDNTDGQVYTIDDFKGPRDISIPQCISDNLFEIFLSGCGDLLETGKLTVIAADHNDINIAINPDMVFLDGSHEYEDVKRDILKWTPYIVKGGIICGDDYTNMIGVRDAVNELFPKRKLVRKTSIWYAKL